MSFAINLTFGTMIFFFLMAAVVDAVSEKEVVQVNCYDRYSNIIEDLTCEDKVIINSLNKNLVLIFGFLGISSLVLIPSILVIIDSLREKQK